MHVRGGVKVDRDHWQRAQPPAAGPRLRLRALDRPNTKPRGAANATRASSSPRAASMHGPACAAVLLTEKPKSAGQGQSSHGPAHKEGGVVPTANG